MVDELYEGAVWVVAIEGAGAVSMGFGFLCDLNPCSHHFGVPPVDVALMVDNEAYMVEPVLLTGRVGDWISRRGFTKAAVERQIVCARAKKQVVIIWLPFDGHTHQINIESTTRFQTIYIESHMTHATGDQRPFVGGGCLSSV